MRRAVVIGSGAYLPARIVPNSELESMVETTHEWIVERTGIEQRHMAEENEVTSDLAVRAGFDAIEQACVSPSTIDMVILATTTPDETMPSTATKVQYRLGITKGAAFDVNAACSGFVYAMTVANSFIVSGQAKRVLVIGAETFSRILDWTDRGTCILFGDGAAAVLLDAREDSQRGILHSNIHSDGQYTHLLATNGGVSSTRTAGKLFMAGKDIFRHAVSKMPAAVEEGMAALNLPLSAIDWLVPHQANLRILAGVGQKLGLTQEKVVCTVPQHANTSAASIPLALHLASKDGRIKEGQLIACPALGAGLTWGCTIIRW
jgi:3-oxoacyl-[acyl-carrier-protein] synthase III